MAYFGAKYPVFRRNGAAEGVVLGKLVGAALTVNLASGELYADDKLAEQESQFASGSVTLETDDMTDAVAAEVYGATVSNGTVIYKSTDTAPMGSLAYIKTLQINGVKLCRAYYYPRVMAAVGNDNVQTKGSSITFQTTSTTFTVMPDRETGEWRETQLCDHLDQAISWINGKMGIAAGSVRLLNLVFYNGATGEEQSLTPAFDPDVTEYELSVTGWASSVFAVAENGSAEIVSVVNGETILDNPFAGVWQDGENIVTVTVTNGEDSETYTVTVTKS